MTDWSQLDDADGSADGLPAILAQLEVGGSDASWDRVWSRLVNQGMVYSASFAALPELLALAEGRPARDRVMPLVLAGAIAASDDLAGGTEEHRQYYLAVFPQLAELADRTLSDSSFRGEPANYVYLLQALLAFQGDKTWATLLGCLADDECEVECPRCATPLVIALREDDHTSAVHDFVAQPTDVRLPLQAVEPGMLAVVGRGLHDRARHDGQQTVAAQLTYLCGQAMCPRCRAGFGVSEAIVGGFER